MLGMVFKRVKITERMYSKVLYFECIIAIADQRSGLVCFIVIMCDMCVNNNNLQKATNWGASILLQMV